jgi:hypothetical protein
MGLDVSLAERAHKEASDLHEKAWDEWYERFKDTPDDDPEKVAAKAAIPPYESRPDVPSERYPEHLFNRRYLRSSYNPGGFNHAVPDFLGSAGSSEYPHERGSLYWIFEPVLTDPDEYTHELTEATIPALEAAKARALQVADELRKCDPLRTMSESLMLGDRDHMWHTPPTEAEVLAWYREEKARNANQPSPFGEGYSNAKGLVLGFSEGTEVLALAVGRSPLGHPAAIAVYRADVTSYVESAEITAEFCDEAIMLIRRDGAAFMHWSG